MLTINLQNVEELIFKNQEIKQLFPELRQIFDKWLLSYRSPALSNMRKLAMIELLNAFDIARIEKLSKHLKDMIFVESLDTNMVKNLEFYVNSPMEETLTRHQNYGNMAISRNANQVYISLWR